MCVCVCLNSWLCTVLLWMHSVWVFVGREAPAERFYGNIRVFHAELDVLVFRILRFFFRDVNLNQYYSLT